MANPDGFTMLLSADIRLALKKEEYSFVEELLTHVHPADIADIIEGLEISEKGIAFGLISLERQVETFEHLEDYQQEELLQTLPSPILIPIIEAMSSDDRADLFKAITKEETISLMAHLTKDEVQDIRRLISYEEETAGSVMTSEYVAIPTDHTVQEALTYIRQVASHRETIYYMYVVDQRKKLQGHISLRDIVLAEPSKKIHSLMNPNVISVQTTDDQEAVAKSIQKYDFLAIPVVDHENILVGIITHDDIMDVVELENTEDAHKMGAVSPLEESYMHTPFWTLVQKRVFWLSVLFVGEMFTSTALNHFEDILHRYMSLIFFIPLIISAGGNVGSQSSTLIVRGMSTGDIALKDWFSVIHRESLIGIAMGVFLGVLGLIRALILGTGFEIGVVVMITVALIVMMGALVGSFLPMLFERIGLDPAVTSAPFVASLVDVFGIVLYFLVAKMILPI